MRVEFTVNATHQQVAHCVTCGDPIVYAAPLVLWTLSSYSRCNYCLDRFLHGASS